MFTVGHDSTHQKQNDMFTVGQDSTQENTDLRSQSDTTAHKKHGLTFTVGQHSRPLPVGLTLPVAPPPELVAFVAVVGDAGRVGEAVPGVSPPVVDFTGGAAVPG